MKYRSAEQAAAMLETINSIDLGGRKIRAEFKKSIMPKTSGKLLSTPSFSS